MRKTTFSKPEDENYHKHMNSTELFKKKHQLREKKQKHELE